MNMIPMEMDFTTLTLPKVSACIVLIVPELLSSCSTESCYDNRLGVHRLSSKYVLLVISIELGMFPKRTREGFPHPAYIR